MKRAFLVALSVAALGLAGCSSASPGLLGSPDGGGAAQDGGPPSGNEGGSVVGDGGSPGDDGGVGNATCSVAVACGDTGATYEECTSLGADGECLGIVYRVSDGHAFSCASCGSCQGAQQELTGYCSGVAPDAGGPDASVDAGGATTCLSPVACGTGGLTFRECTTTSGSGACTSITYDVSSGVVFTCASCGSCSGAAAQLNTYCASQGTPITTCTAMSPCESSPLTYETCTTTLGGVCQSSTLQTSDGQHFACAACGNCAAATASLDAYCTAQTPPVTTCGAASACGAGGATYAPCTTSQGAVCESIAYTTSTGQKFACNSCSDCTAALTSVETYCASLTTTGGAVLYGGFASGGTTALGDTWVWSGSAWNAGPTVGPPARGDTTGVVVGSQFLVFGGTSALSAVAPLGDTWGWNASGWTSLSTTGPSARFGASLAPYGSGALLFGGDATSSGASSLADTWLWNGSAWSAVAVTGTAPPARVGATAATLNGQVVLFGGMGTGSTYLNDTWVFNGTQWTPMTPAASPPARFYASMVTLGSQIVLFGGYGAGYLADTWTWNGATWTPLTPTTSPSARAGAAMATVNGTALLFGGDASGTYVADTWIWNGATWVSQTATGPQARFGGTMGGL